MTYARPVAVLLFVYAGTAGATVITQVAAATGSLRDGVSSCQQGGQGLAQCSIGSGLVHSHADANGGWDWVSVSIGGGAADRTGWASASSSAVLQREYRFTGGVGEGLLVYDVVLAAYYSGSLSSQNGFAVLNGTRYGLGPGGSSVFRFTRSFQYGEPFTVTLSVGLNDSWSGARGEGGSGSVNARISGISTQAVVPEPATAVLLWAGLLLAAAGRLRRSRSFQRISADFRRERVP